MNNKIDFLFKQNSIGFFLLDLKDKREQSGYCFAILIVLSYVLVVFTFPLSLCFCLKVSILFINIRFILLFDNKKKTGSSRI